MIFRHLLPDVVRADKFDRSKGALLRVNRQFYQEASSIIYGDARFEVVVASTHISMFGKKWWREPLSHSTDSFKEVLCQAGAQRIRTLEVEVRFSRFRSRPKFLGKNDVSYEDYDLYQLRDSVRKLVQLLYAQFPEGNTKALRRLEVKPILSVQHPWQADEFAAATFVVLEPFLFLSPVDELKLVPPSRPEGVYMHERDTADTIGSLRKNRRFCSLAKEWRMIMEGTSTVARDEQPHRQNQPHGRFAALYRRIEDFARVISKQDSAPESVQGHKWGSSVFQGMERVLHLARLAYEHEDEKRLEQIRIAIMIRWVNAQRQEQRALTEVANSISGMFIGYLQDLPQDLYPNEFIFPSDDLIEQETDATQLWPELDAEDTAPQIGGHGVKFSEDNLRVYIRKRGNLFIRLKTPAMVRHLRKIKEDGDDSE
ncbi:hypothetical protein SLS59_001604 [Nothophoma quercina]|uniref:Uncharacterized protein n=1 Tax=Nothophoma quercina TaxID=749835 RepID=A0ABR3RXU7_9PLEO